MQNALLDLMMRDGRCLVLLWVIFVLTTFGCGLKFERIPETDAELTCRQNGFRRGSTGYADCVELVAKRGDAYESED